MRIFGTMRDWPVGYGLSVLDEVDSTLDEAARIAPGLDGPHWIMARRQLKGRGRRGRVWHDPPGNLAATLILPAGDPPARAALRSFVASLALFDALGAVSGQDDGLALKWPNDVLLNGGKLAGILLEGGPHLAIGIGVNLSSVPTSVETGAVRPVSLKGETGIEIGPEDFLVHLAAAFATHESMFQTNGFAPIRATWLDRAARLGETITARIGDTRLTGRFETVDEAGHLVLGTSGGQQRIAAAEIFF